MGKSTPQQKEKRSMLRRETIRAIGSVFLFVLAIILILAAIDRAGFLGTSAYHGLSFLFGAGYFLLPALALAASVLLMRGTEHTLGARHAAGFFFLILSALGLFEAVSADAGGIIGHGIHMALVRAFDVYASFALLVGIALISVMVALDTPIEFSFLGRAASPLRSLFLSPFSLSALFHTQKEEEEETVPVRVIETEGEKSTAHTPPEKNESGEEKQDATEKESEEKKGVRDILGDMLKGTSPTPLTYSYSSYTSPPLSLLERDRGKPAVGDTKANANIIKRTLQNFGIRVEMDEICVGPTVTRYAMKPAEGVRLSKILSLQSNLELALAASPIRIEAPIPGKSLVGIEVPNITKATLGLGSTLGMDEFIKSMKPLTIALGKDITGGAHFADISKMPHLLIAGTTGSGKSVMIHTLITSLLFRNGPGALRLILIDPKRVELTLYNRIPHLLHSVITDPKRVIMALRWAAKEMERRYDILETESVRDISSYHQNIVAPALERARARGADIEDPEEAATLPEPMPHIVIVIDELADIMQSYPRELEAAIVRLAQMSRAVGIHLVLSTQRPSVNVITGLIKANIPARIALQVASQIDSRTILDMTGAEKLLGAGDMLYLSGEMSKPRRLQSPFITENEVKKVVSFLAEKNIASEDMIELTAETGSNALFASGDLNESGQGEEDDDGLYEAAREEVQKVGRASTSFLQRRLRIGYSRAARIMDQLEERGVIAPSDGSSKAREVIGSSTGGLSQIQEEEDAEEKILTR